MGPRTKRQPKIKAKTPVTQLLKSQEATDPFSSLTTWKAAVLKVSTGYYRDRSDGWWLSLWQQVQNVREHDLAGEFAEAVHLHKGTTPWLKNPKELIPKFEDFVREKLGANAEADDPIQQCEKARNRPRFAEYALDIDGCADRNWGSLLSNAQEDLNHWLAWLARKPESVQKTAEVAAASASSDVLLTTVTRCKQELTEGVEDALVAPSYAVQSHQLGRFAEKFQRSRNKLKKVKKHELFSAPFHSVQTEPAAPETVAVAVEAMAATDVNNTIEDDKGAGAQCEQETVPGTLPDGPDESDEAVESVADAGAAHGEVPPSLPTPENSTDLHVSKPNEVMVQEENAAETEKDIQDIEMSDADAPACPDGSIVPAESDISDISMDAWSGGSPKAELECDEYGLLTKVK